MGDYTKRLQWLKETHRFLYKKVDVMEKIGNFKDEELNEMKKKRLKLKDQIKSMEKEHAV